MFYTKIITYNYIKMNKKEKGKKRKKRNNSLL